MAANNDFHKNLLDSLYDGVYFVDRERRITYWNKGAERLTGYKAAEVVGMRCSDNVLIHINEQGISLCEGQCPAAETIADGRPREAELYLHHKEGYRVPVSIRLAPIQDPNGQVIGAVEVFSDNSSKVAIMQRIEELQKIALFDPLTELGNRRHAEMNLTVRFDEMHRYGWAFGILFIDIDRFKAVNDAYGHNIGDEVLKMVAKKLLNNVRSFDMVNRWGGEEFIAIIVNIQEDQLYDIANKLRLLVEQSSLSVGSDIIRVTISIGATLARANEEGDTLLKRADQLMYHSKTAGRNRVSMT